MSSGGARARSGPAPQVDAAGVPVALRRGKDAGAGWTHLPAEGRQGEMPAWPLTRPSRRELVIWEGEWRRPQAVIWDANGQQLEVALYVRSLVEAERPKAPTAARDLVKKWQATLGLSLDGLAKNNWIIDLPATAKPEPVAATGTDGAPGRTARDRLKVVSRGS